MLNETPLSTVNTAGGSPVRTPRSSSLENKVERKGRLLLVDDDSLFREALGQNLTAEGYAVECVDGGEAALSKLAEQSDIDAVLLDWRMPPLDGQAVFRLMLQRGYTMPVLFLTGLTDSVYEEAALALGAVDFIDKSRSLPVILQRLSLIVERSKRVPVVRSDGVRRGRLELQPLRARALWDNKRAALTLTEFTILQTLAETPKREVSYREIYDLVRGEGFLAGWGEEGYRVNVRSFIKRIRQKFRAIDDKFDCIRNFSGHGYYWDPVE